MMTFEERESNLKEKERGDVKNNSNCRDDLGVSFKQTKRSAQQQTRVAVDYTTAADNNTDGFCRS